MTGCGSSRRLCIGTIDCGFLWRGVAWRGVVGSERERSVRSEAAPHELASGWARLLVCAIGFGGTRFFPIQAAGGLAARQSGRASTRRGVSLGKRDSRASAFVGLHRERLQRHSGRGAEPARTLEWTADAWTSRSVSMTGWTDHSRRLVCWSLASMVVHPSLQVPYGGHEHRIENPLSPLLRRRG
jgi:hypothetical protein